MNILFNKYQKQENILFREKNYQSFIKIYEEVNNEIGYPLNEKIELRNYQKESLGMFFYHYEKENKNIPIHLLFNLATGSGKTVLMAYLIYYLHSKGYSNFVFLVNSVSILTKTVDNFINKKSIKYLFRHNISVNIKESNSFADSFIKNTININFTTIQGLASNIYKVKENSLDLDSLKNHKVVLFADEAHHLNADTKDVNYSKDSFLSNLDNAKNIDNFIKIQKNLNKTKDKDINKKLEEYFKNEKKSWEKCVLEVLNSNKNNLLLEFTATIGCDENVLNKYKDKIIYQYDLKKYREDKFTKEIELIKLSDDVGIFYKDRILLGLINNVYRQKLFEEIKYSITPIILFKSKDTKENKENYDNFFKYIKNIKQSDIEEFLLKYKNNKLNEYFHNILETYKNYEAVISIIKSLFNEETVKIVDSLNSKGEDLSYLNNLDNKNNKIRAIFQVDMLNEGWDVLSLFDIIRLQDGRSNVKNKSTGKIKVGPQTVKEAQLIGRGARYLPFIFNGNKANKSIRKFDSDVDNKYRILETMFYYSNDDNLYITELKKAMKEQGLDIDENSKNIKLQLKEDVIKKAKENNLFLFVNNIEKSKIKTSMLEIKKETDNYKETFVDINTLSSIKIMEDLEEEYQELKTNTKEGNLNSLGIHKGIIYKSLRKNCFFQFDNLKEQIEDINSIQEFIDIISNINLVYNTNSCFDKNKKLKIVNNIIKRIKNFIEKNTINKKSKDFKKINLLEVFSENKTIKVPVNSECKIYGDWFSHKEFYGNNLENKLITEFKIKLESDFFKKYSNHLLIRNEKELTIYDDKGQAFQPDFIWIFDDGGYKKYNQVFIEPKGEFLSEKDSWKEDFLNSINEKIESDNFIFHILGNDFFNDTTDNKDFWNDIEKKLNN